MSTVVTKVTDLFKAREGGEPAVDTPICVVIPAYNEASRISTVLDIVTRASSVDEIIVVDDGSLDGTGAIVAAHPATAAGTIRLLQHSPNRGKGAAMRTGAEATKAPVIVFFDADLIGLTPDHVEALVQPVVAGRATMAPGVFRGGRGSTTLAQILAPNISGQRAIRRDVFLEIPNLTTSGYGVELAITSFVLGEGLPVARVVLRNVTHPMKEEKLGFLRGAASRFRMYYQMLPFILRLRRRRTRGGH